MMLEISSLYHYIVPWNKHLQVNLGVSLGIYSRRIDLAQEVQRILDALVEIRDSLLRVLVRLQLNTSQTADVGLDSLCRILDLKSEGKLVLNKTSLWVSVDIHIVGLGVLLSLCQDVIKGLETLGESGNDCVVDGD